MAIVLNGVKYSRPGVYSNVKIISEQSAADALFKVPVFCVSGLRSIKPNKPFFVNNGNEDLVLFDDAGAAGAAFGRPGEHPENDAEPALQAYLKHGPVTPYVVNTRPLYAASAITFGPAGLVMTANIYGAEFNRWSLGIDYLTNPAGKCVVILRPIRALHYLKATAAVGATSITVYGDTSDVFVGQSYYLYQSGATVADHQASTAKTVTMVSGNTITFSAAVGGSASWVTTKYAFLCQADPSRDITSPYVDANWDAVTDYLESSGYFNITTRPTPGTAIADNVTPAFITTMITESVTPGDPTLLGYALAHSDVEATYGTPGLVDKIEQWALGNYRARFFWVSMAESGAATSTRAGVYGRILQLADQAGYMSANYLQREIYFFTGDAVDLATNLALTVPSNDTTNMAHPANVTFNISSASSGAAFVHFAAANNGSSKMGVDQHPAKTTGIGYNANIALATQAMGDWLKPSTPYYHNSTGKQIFATQLGAFQEFGNDTSVLVDYGVLVPIFRNSDAFTGYAWCRDGNAFRASKQGMAAERYDQVTSYYGGPAGMILRSAILNNLYEALMDALRIDGVTINNFKVAAQRVMQAFEDKGEITVPQDGDPDTAWFISDIRYEGATAVKLTVAYHPRNVIDFVFLTLGIVAKP